MSSSESRRVAITGIGVISPLGNSKEALFDGLSSGKNGVRDIESLANFEGDVRFGGEAVEFTEHIDNFGTLPKDQKKMIRKGLKMMCRETKMGVAAAQLAFQDAGMEVGSYDPERTGCVFGSDYMLTMPEDFRAGAQKCADDEGEFDYSQWGGEGLGMVNPLWLLLYLPNMPASHVAIYNDLRGTSNSLTQREAAPNLAIGEASRIIQRGSADVMVAGATGTRLHPMNMMHAIAQEEIAGNGVAPEKASRPFDRDRSGMALGEGAGVMLLEDLDAAQSREATILGEIIGAASSAVTKAPSVADRRQAIVNSLRAALADAGLSPSDIGHIHAHGLSTRSCDAEEAAAIVEVFGSREEQPPVVAAKSHFGNLGCGSGAVELAGSLMAIRSGKLFPVLNYETPDDDCPLNIATADTDAGQTVANINVTPQGQASVLIVRGAE